MWSAPQEPWDSIVATAPTRPVERRRKAPPAPPRLEYVPPETTELEISTLEIVRPRASYRDPARLQGGGLRAVIRSSGRSSHARYHRVGEVILALGVSVLPILIVASIVPPFFGRVFATFILVLIAGGAYGALPVFGRAISGLYDFVASLTGGRNVDPPAPAVTTLDCHEGAELIITRTANRRHPLRVVVPACALASLRVHVARSRACLCVEHAGEEVVLADDLPVAAARALAASLRRVGSGARVATLAE